MKDFDYAFVGGGIVGLASALSLAQKKPKAKILLLDKESGPARHQTGRNSGVIHSGIYYKPGSLKARFGLAGCTSMTQFAEEYGIAFETCGKVIIATDEKELPGLKNIFERGQKNQVPVKMLSQEEVLEIEPHVNAIQGIQVRSTGIIDYKGVCQKLVELLQRAGVEIRFNEEVVGISNSAVDSHAVGREQIVFTRLNNYSVKRLINCGGLHSDRIARMCGSKTTIQIVPFRGEYFELDHSKTHLVKGLIYPVPNPDFPFLGVHLTKIVGGGVHAGPNAVFALAREGYDWKTFNFGDVAESLSFPGFWKFIFPNLGEGMKEMARSFSKKLFAKSLQRLVPEVSEADLIPSAAGVRAQALTRDGKLVDDFAIERDPFGNLHILNAPSPAATASLEIGNEISRIAIAEV